MVVFAFGFALAFVLGFAAVLSDAAFRGRPGPRFFVFADERLFFDISLLSSKISRGISTSFRLVLHAAFDFLAVVDLVLDVALFDVLDVEGDLRRDPPAVPVVLLDRARGFLGLTTGIEMPFIPIPWRSMGTEGLTCVAIINPFADVTNARGGRAVIAFNVDTPCIGKPPLYVLGALGRVIGILPVGAFPDFEDTVFFAACAVILDAARAVALFVFLRAVSEVLVFFTRGFRAGLRAALARFFAPVLLAFFFDFE